MNVHLQRSLTRWHRKKTPISRMITIWQMIGNELEIFSNSHKRSSINFRSRRLILNLVISTINFILNVFSLKKLYKYWLCRLRYFCYRGIIDPCCDKSGNCFHRCNWFVVCTRQTSIFWIKSQNPKEDFKRLTHKSKTDRASSSTNDFAIFQMLKWNLSFKIFSVPFKKTLQSHCYFKLTFWLCVGEEAAKNSVRSVRVFNVSIKTRVKLKQSVVLVFSWN